MFIWTFLWRSVKCSLSSFDAASVTNWLLGGKVLIFSGRLFQKASSMLKKV